MKSIQRKPAQAISCSGAFGDGDGFGGSDTTVRVIKSF